MSTETQKIEIILKEIEVNKINLEPGDTLVIKMKGSEFLEEGVMESFQQHAQKLFPNNRISVLCMPVDHDIVFEKVEKADGE